jgi:hypothetical protein
LAAADQAPQVSGKLVLGVSLLLAAAASFAGSAGGQFAVLITLNKDSNGTCTSASGSGAGSALVQVQCTANVFVNIAQVNVPQNGRFMPGFSPTRDSLLPDYCRSEISRGDQAARVICRLDDQSPPIASSDGEEGWKIESRLYAVNTDDDAALTQARSRLQEDRGILTAIRVASADGRAGPVEILVSF